MTPIPIATMLVVSLVSLAAATATASDDDARYRQLKQEAHRAFELGKYDLAISNFETAYRARVDPRLFYNLGLCYLKRSELTGVRSDLALAKTMFTRFLRQVTLGDYPQSKRPKIKIARRFATEHLRQISRRIAEMEHRPASARTTPKRTTPTRPVTRPAMVGWPAKQAPDASAKRRSALHWIFYGLSGTFAVAAGVVGGLALHESSRSYELKDARDPSTNSVADRADRLALASDVMIGATALSLTAAIVLHVLSRERRSTTPLARGKFDARSNSPFKPHLSWRF